MKTAELEGPALDWAVASCLGYTDLRKNPHRFDDSWIMTPPRESYGPVLLVDNDFSTNWAQGGPIIERESISLAKMHGHGWWADCGKASTGPTPLIAAMRCFVASELGDEVEIPEELK